MKFGAVMRAMLKDGGPVPDGRWADLAVLEAVRAAGVRRLVFAASSSAYGDQKTSPKHEGMVPMPISPYAATKRAGELIAHTFHHLHGLSATCLRFFTVYGPRQRPEDRFAERAANAG